MNLQLRLNLMIAGVLALALLVGVMLVIQGARQAVEEELRAAARLTLQLLDVALATSSSADAGDAQYNRLLEQLATLESTRHLDIQLRTGAGILRVNRGAGADRVPEAPAWFVRLVVPAPMEFTRPLSPIDDAAGRIVLRSDPADEISEAWTEARGLLGLLLVFSVLANVIVFYTVGRGLRPIGVILAALEGVERGNYALRLPAFALPELSRISQSFNRMAERLARSVEENRRLTQHSLAIQEAERRHLARELHDELGQCVSAIRAHAASIANRSRGDCPEVHESAQAIITVSSQVHEAVRGMMRRLRPSMLDELGLVTTLRETVKDWNAHHPQVHCEFVVSGMFDDLSEATRITVYRVVQEGLTNIARHAAATRVEIRLERDDATEPDPAEHEADGREYVHLSIQDNGKGFDADAPHPGFGLRGMAERVQALHGIFTVTSNPGEGVWLRISIPLSPQTITA